MRLLALVAGTNDPSNADVLCDAFLRGVRAHAPQAEIVKLRLKDLRIDHFTLENYHPACSTEDDFCRLQDLVQRADGLVFSTPIWNFSVPAHLKNVIDRMGAFCLDEATRSEGQLLGTPVYFLYTGGAPKPVWKGLMQFTTSHLPEALRYYGASVIGRHFEGKCMTGRGAFGLVLDKRTTALEAAARRGQRFAAIVDRFERTKKLPLKYYVIGKMYRWGQRVVAKIL